MNTIDISIYTVKEPFKVVKGFDGSKEKEVELLDGVPGGQTVVLCENEVCHVQRYPDGSLTVTVVEDRAPIV